MHTMNGTPVLGASNGTRTTMLFDRFKGAAKKNAKQGTKQIKKSLPKSAPGGGTVKRAASPIKSVVPRTNSRKGGDGLWLPNTERPEWLDGSLPGDRGFDPLGLSRPTEYLQVDIDELDGSAAVNKAGQVIGDFQNRANAIVSDTALAPYDEVFGLERFRENEVIHGRWAMLATLGVIIGELSTGVSWVDAGKVELDGAQYLGFRLPFTISQLVWIEAILVGGAEIYRNRETELERRIYPGGAFDPLNFASGDSDRAFRLKEAELKHGRLAMVAFLGFSVQAAVTGQGALGSLAKFIEEAEGVAEGKGL